MIQIDARGQSWKNAKWFQMISIESFQVDRVFSVNFLKGIKREREEVYSLLIQCAVEERRLLG